MADLTRRTVLTTLSVVGAAAVAPSAAWSTGTPMLRTAADASPTLVSGATFPEGIMAGVPRTDGATLWTRVPRGACVVRADAGAAVQQRHDAHLPLTAAGPDRRVVCHRHRQYKDDQPCDDGGSIICAAADDPGRSMLGAAQKAWLKDGLRTSGARWKVLANPNMMMGMITGAAGERAFMDTWDGYGAERTELLSLAAERVADLVVVTGDDHDTFSGELWDSGFAPGSPGNPGGTRRAGVEFVVPSVSSTNTGDLQGSTGAKAEEQKRLQYNPHLKMVDMRQHGYGVLEVGQDDARLSYRAVDKLHANAGVSTSYQVRTARGSSTLDVL